MDIKDPLKPFTSGNHQYDSRNAFLQNDINAPMSEQQFNEIFKKITSIPNFLHEDKAPILKSLYDDMKVICDCFNPLYKAGVENLVIDLTGGAVRDFVLNRHEQIKDIDVMVSVDFANMNHLLQVLRIDEKTLLNVGFTSEELQQVKWENTPPEALEAWPNNYSLIENPVALGSSHLNKLVYLCVSRLKGEQENFMHGEKDMLLEKVPTKDPNYDKSIRDRLTGVIKVKSPQLKFPADILITNNGKADFLKNFDINLCKASFSFINKFYGAKFPTDYSHLISRFSSCMDFFADVVNKKMTLVVDDRADISLQASVNRLYRLKEKYPEHDFNFALFANTDINSHKLNYVKSLKWKRDIESSIDMADKENSKKMKI